MNIIDIENYRLSLLKVFDTSDSIRKKLILLSEFFQHLFDCKNQNIINSYLLEFAEDYVKLLAKWEVFYLSPKESEKIIEISNKLLKLKEFKPFTDSLNLNIARINNGITDLARILNGDESVSQIWQNKIHFPLIEAEESANQKLFSYLESLTVKISRGKDSNKFIIVPSFPVIEEKLQIQIENSWTKAIEVINRYYKRTHKFHDVVISFDQKLGEYIGNSLGIALTLAFLQELFNFYNTPIRLITKPDTAFTGGLNENGDVIPINNSSYIRSKVKCAFFSQISKLVIPKKDEEAAGYELNDLWKDYPNRKLKLIGIDDFEDLINRRDLVEINKQNLAVRSAKMVYKYKYVVLLMILFAAAILFLNIDYDKNPAFFKSIENRIYVLNKNGKVLWDQKIARRLNKDDILPLFAKVIDLDDDGSNEVLFSQAVLKSKNPYNSLGWVACFNNNGHLLWKNQFADSAETYKDLHTTTYENYLIDVISENKDKIVYLFANNAPLYPSVIYRLNAKTGKRINGTFWHAGHILGAKLGKYENDENEIVGLAINNCFERCVLFSINADSINGQAPALKNYRFYNVPDAHLNKFILLPKSDLTNFDKLRYNSTKIGNLMYQNENNQFGFYTFEGDYNRYAGISYQVSSDLTKFNINISDAFQVERDSLVAKGLLPKPYSNTKEYFEILKKQIKYWDGSEFKDMY